MFILYKQFHTQKSKSYISFLFYEIGEIIVHVLMKKKLMTRIASVSFELASAWRVVVSIPNQGECLLVQTTSYYYGYYFSSDNCTGFGRYPRENFILYLKQRFLLRK